MTIVCINRPNRTYPRRYTAKDVGRIACYAMDAGATQQEIISELNKRCLKDLCDCERIRSVVLDLLSLLLGAVIAFFVPIEAAAGAMLALISRVPAIARLVRLVPGLEDLLTTLSLPTTRLEIEAFITQIELQVKLLTRG